MRRSVCLSVLVSLVLGFGPVVADGLFERTRIPRAHDPVLVADYFLDDPIGRHDSVIAGPALDRVEYRFSPPAWPGDHPGSLLGRYDASAPAGLFGLALSQSLDQDDDFTAAAILVVESDGFVADPNGFFQISWGLWNGQTTGLDRTGDPSSFAADTFDSIGFDYFPNISPFFGGPFLSPSIFGVANAASPAFPSQGAFANAGFAFGVEVEIPLDEPLLAVIEHKPALDVAVMSIHRIVGARATVPLPGAVTVIPLDALSIREYQLDTIGLMLWHDGFGGPEPAVLAHVVFHGLVARPGFFPSYDAILRTPPRRR